MLISILESVAEVFGFLSDLLRHYLRNILTPTALQLSIVLLAWRCYGSGFRIIFSDDQAAVGATILIVLLALIGVVGGVGTVRILKLDNQEIYKLNRQLREINEVDMELSVSQLD